MYWFEELKQIKAHAAKKKSNSNRFNRFSGLVPRIPLMHRFTPVSIMFRIFNIVYYCSFMRRTTGSPDTLRFIRRRKCQK